MGQTVLGLSNRAARIENSGKGRSLKVIEVVGAVITKDGKVLCAQRGADGGLPLMWEFPGGKIEPGETAREALQREIQEELQCVVDVGPRITTTVHEYDFATISLTTFKCSLVEGTPRLSEHAEVRWLTPQELPTLEWAPADIPAVTMISEGSHLEG